MFSALKALKCRHRLQSLLLLVAAMVSLTQVAAANTAGGWTPLVTTPVTTGNETFNGVTDKYLDNGILHVLIAPNGSVDSIKYLKPGLAGTPKANGVETVSQSGVNFGNHTAIYYYWFPDGNGDCIFLNTLTSSTNIDLGYVRLYNPAVHDVAAHVELRYSLGQGNSGLYAYLIVHHPTSLTNIAANLSISFIQCLWPTAHDTMNFLCENSYVDDSVRYGLQTNGVFQKRNGLQPNFFDAWHQVALNATNIPVEVTKYTTGFFSGSTNGKYSYTFDYPKLSTFGMASDINRIGLWYVAGGHEYQNNGPTANEYSGGIGGLITFEPLIAHYGNTGLNVRSNAVFNMVYGPWMFYINSGTNGADCWEDSKRQAVAERQAWPYAWLTNVFYQSRSQRAVVSGRLIINDPLRPQANAAGAWVGLAAKDAGVENASDNWQLQSDGYQFWTQCADDGSFTLPPVATVTTFGTNATYQLYAYCAGTNGSVGEFRGGIYTFAPGTVTNLGTFTWTVPHKGNSIAWEMGYPDRTAAEYRHGDEYGIPALWLGFSKEFPNPMTYTVGLSDPRIDWNYAQTAYFTNGIGFADAVAKNMVWHIRFNLTNVPASGNATLNIAFAGAASAAIRMYVNDPNMTGAFFGDFFPNVPSGANSLIRNGIHDKYGINHTNIPVNKFVVGTNTITLVQRRATTATSSYVMYDYLNLEMPTPISPPGLTAAPGDGQIVLNWSASPGATGYNLRQSTTNGGPYKLVATNLNSLVFTNNGLTNGIYYYYTLNATNASGGSGWSMQVSARPVSGTSPQINSIAAPGQLRLIWPQENTGWTLQAQTNPVDKGIGTNWETILNSSGTNEIILQVDTNGSVFYRLIYP